MEITFDNVLDQMLQSAGDAFENGWESVKDYAPAEFKKISHQVIEITDNVAKYKLDSSQGYSAETGKILLQMQRTATEGVLVAISTLTLIAVQNAINAIFQVLKDTFGGILSTIL
jgi:hypothetical protein